jgi:hypothetical protein
VTAVPLAFGFHISPNAADTLATGAEPNMPSKNRVMKMDCGFLLVAVPIEKSPRQNIAGSIDIRRPHISETGAQRIGPNAKPRLFVKETLAIVTVRWR